MTEAPEWWVPLPARFPRKPKPSHLRAQYGAAGPYVFVVMLAEAADQYYGTTPRRRVEGKVRMGWAELDGLAACGGINVARNIVQAMSDMGEIVLDQADEIGFTARFVDWAEWSPAGPPKDPEAAERQRRHREKKKREQGTDTP